MSTPSATTRGTLRRRVLITGAGATFILVTGLVVFLAISDHLRARLTERTDAYLEEQRIANELTGAVMRQILLVSARPDRPFGGLGVDFQAVGDQANALIQRYLFRDLSPEERLQLERVKAAHQRLEVAAARAAEVEAGTERRDAASPSGDLIAQASALQDALHDFLQMREAGLESLRSRQAAAFNALYFGVGTVAVLVVVGSAFLGRFLQHRVSEPLSALTEAAQRLGEGDLEARVPTDHDREFAAVAVTFNQMARDLQAVQENLESRNRQLAEALETLRLAQTEVIEIEKLSAMGRMTAGLAHELNNPLASVLGYGELLRERLAEYEDPEARRIHDELVAPIVQEAARARRLVGNFIQFARGSESGVGPAPVRDALDVVVGLRAFAFDRAGLELSVGAVPDVWVRAERQRLQEVFLNLVSNAFDAMEGQDEGRLHVEGELREGTLVLRFEDEGPGFESLDRAFEPFYTTKPVGAGAGLGLALVHRTMEHFGGSVRLENRPDGGAHVILSFTVVDPPPRATEHDTAEGGGADPRRAARTSPRILVVEDEAALRRLQQRILGRLDAEVFLASTVADAWPILESEDLDLIVSDVKMPGESGLDLYHAVLDRRPELGERFLFVTGDVGDPVIAELRGERPELFICKPFDIHAYLERVSATLTRPRG